MARARSGSSSIRVRARLPPLVLGVVGSILVLGLIAAATGATATGTTAADRLPWWAYALFLLPAIAMAALGVVLGLDPRSLARRRALAGTAMLWLFFLAAIALLLAFSDDDRVIALMFAALAAAVGAGLLGLAATTAWVAPEIDETSAIGRFGAVVAFALAVLVASVALVVLAVGAIGLWRALTEGRLPARLPWGAFVVILILPAITFLVAAAGTRRAAGGTFLAQAAANRRSSLLLLVTLVGVVAATAELITATVTFQAVPALWAAGLAALVGLGAAAGADRFGGDLVLRTAGAHPAREPDDTVLLNVVRELALAAALPMPAVFIVEDGSQNAFATGRDPAHASVAVTRGLLDQLDREELQGVIGHELGHVRNLDTRYALYVAVLVGLVALVTDGFLRTVVEGWRQGAFVWGGDADDIRATVAAFVTGILVGLFLLAVALVLRLVAPLFAAMVQAATSREREFLADATSVEFTRNPRGLERALATISADGDPLEGANRGTQHLWFRNPVKPGSDRGASLLATHPSIGARIARLRALQGLGPIDPDVAVRADAET